MIKPGLTRSSFYIQTIRKAVGGIVFHLSRMRLAWLAMGTFPVILLAACVPVMPAATTVAPTGLSPISEQPGMEYPSPTPSAAFEPNSTLYFTLTPTALKSTPGPIPATPTPAWKMCTPLDGHTWQDLQEIVSFPYDPPPPGKDTGHHGVDFAYYRRGERQTILGVSIQAVLAGRVAALVPNRPPYGNMLIVETEFVELPESLRAMLEMRAGESLYLLYAHMNQEPIPGKGERVECGQALGEVGNTPPEWSSAPHLHLEARVGPSGESFDSIAFYSNTVSVEEMENYTRWRMSGEFRLVDPLSLLSYGLED